VLPAKREEGYKFFSYAIFVFGELIVNYNRNSCLHNNRIIYQGPGAPDNNMYLKFLVYLMVECYQER
jgi:hypothetical protein